MTDEQPTQVEQAEAESDSGISASMDGVALLPSLEEAEPGRRRRVILVALLATLAFALILFSAWYIAFRKPINALPLPLPAGDLMPAYGYSFYGPVHPMGVAVNSDGSRIYVTQTDADAQVFVFDRTGQRVATITPPNPQIDHAFVYVAVHPSTGEVYVTDRPAAAIHIYSRDGEFLRTFDPPESLAGWTPLGVGFASDGSMFVTDPSVGVVHEFDGQGNLARTVGTNNQFNFPNSVVEDAAGRLYVADSNNGRLVVLDRDGAQLAVIRRGAADGDLGLPRGMALDDAQRLYVADPMDQSIKVYQASGDPTVAPTFIGRFGDEGAGDGAFRFPNAVATDARGRVYVADWENDRVQVWTY